MRKHGRVDRNQKEIVEALREAGASVQSLANIGNGCPDLLVGYMGRTYLMEVKGIDGKYTLDQSAWLIRWKGHTVNTVRTKHDALKAIKR